MNINELNSKLKNIFSNKIIRFALTGSAGAMINLLIIYILVKLLKLNTSVLENFANIIALEFSIIFSFIVNRNWTWIERKDFGKKSIVRQFIYFHFAVAISVLFRIIIFPIFQYLGLNYLFNTAIGIILGAVINYFSFDKLIFVQKKPTK